MLFDVIDSGMYEKMAETLYGPDWKNVLKGSSITIKGDKMIRDVCRIYSIKIDDLASEVDVIRINHGL